MDDLDTYAEKTWCSGCGNFGILTAFKQALRKLQDKGIPKERIVLTAGIGQHGKIFDYLNVSGFYGLHGRSMTTAQGIKLANPDLKVITFAGDGDAFGEGLEHMVFAAKRNADITVIVHDNAVYGLTTGQYTPTSPKGYHGPSTPRGSVEEPINPLLLLLAAGATFVARGFPGHLPHLTDLMVQAIEHEGFSFLDVLQPCVTFNNTWDKYRSMVEPLDGAAGSLEEAMSWAQRTDKLPIGVFYQVQKPAFHRELYRDWNPVRNRFSREERLEKVKTLVR
ncbi:MAG: thiamine pyrophosphate-dependent enzyme [Anaerolineae bacterium]